MSGKVCASLRAEKRQQEGQGGLKSGDLMKLGQEAEQVSLGSAGRCEKYGLGKGGGRTGLPQPL